ncbi:Bifunctional lysine-specific demethylase and histidyl-hydroxylase NO66 [Frankliniella fusca]|uniref:Bifunctional lysine-specific demethylase and histidyl-hydroxylase n=1 Tax=Frankliniella fusca TaxID=407009 RepID=A0AAE1H592_9NEOP|nr:Bifunctional lysine-specific demethylase and histidyl-hydroxylase NO66 [Frankliniella fusca]
MVAAPISAFEMYQNQKKKSKKRSSKKKDKNKQPVKVNDLVSAELLKAVSVKSNKDVNVIDDTAQSSNDLPAKEELQFNIVEVAPRLKKKKKKDQDKQNNVEVSSRKEKSKKKEIVHGEEAVDMVDLDNEDDGNESGELKSISPEELNVNSKILKNKLKPASPAKSIHLSDGDSSIAIAEKFFSWMIDPIAKDDFFSLYWEKRPVHISRKGNRDYFSKILSTKSIDEMFRKHNILFGKNVDVTSYSSGKRETLNSTGRAHAAVVWDYYRNGCSIRLLNPQTYHLQLRELNTRLQEVFGSFVGANAYLTPPNSQGFAPHYDDIEAFVLQIEGSKMWRVYAPRDSSEKLPRTSSPNFTQEEIGDPILEVLVKAGDLLYFPRGFIHQASTVPGEHSLHVTVSTYQRNSWADLLEKLVPAALANAIDEDEEFRKGMPLDVMNHIGAVHSDSETPGRYAVLKKLKKLFSKLFEYAPVDAAADQMAKEYIHDSLPPCLSADEKKCSVLENSERMVSDGKLQGAVVLTPDTCIRLTRSNVLRLVSEEEPDTLKIYHSMENSLEYHGEELQFIEIPLNFAPAVEYLIHSYPSFTAISDLPLDQDSDKVQITTELWERGLVLTETPLSTSE